MFVKKEYHSGNHSKYLLKVHLILVCKYRKKLLLLPDIVDDVKNICYSIFKTNGFVIDSMEVDKDHLHLLIDFEPKVAISEVARKLKSATTVYLWKHHQTLLKKEFWVEHTFWSDGYFATTTGDASTDTIKKYIEEQG